MEENEVKGRMVAIDIVKANVFAIVIMMVAAIVFLSSAVCPCWHGVSSSLLPLPVTFG